MKDSNPNRPERMIVPILLPTGRDAELVHGQLKRDRIDAVICRSLSELLDLLRAGCGPFVLGDEVLCGDAPDRLAAALDGQPKWSDQPGIIFTGRAGPPPYTDLLAKYRQILLIQRPIKKALFLDMIRTAVEARYRQFQIRDLLEDLIRTNEKMRSHTLLLQKLALDLTRAEDRERRRIAGILHDDLQQMLASAKLQTEMLYDDLDDRSRTRAKAVYEILSEAIQASRHLSHELSPAFLTRSGLGEAVVKLGERISETYGFQVHTSVQYGENQLSEDIKSFVYRSVQELLFNCAKHARANRVSLDLTRQRNLLTVSVTDDGKGFDSSALKIYGGKKEGFGLFSIRERAMALGGSFQAAGLPGKGCRFVLQVPVEEDASGQANDAASAIIAEAVSDPATPRRVCPERSDVISVIIADDHTVMRQGLAALLDSYPGLMVVAQAANGEEAVSLALQLRPDVVLMDLRMPLLNGEDATRKIKAEAPEITVIGLSLYSEPDAQRRMLEAGARTYISKNLQALELIATIKESLRPRLAAGVDPLRTAPADITPSTG